MTLSWRRSRADPALILVGVGPLGDDGVMDGLEGHQDRPVMVRVEGTPSLEQQPSGITSRFLSRVQAHHRQKWLHEATYREPRSMPFEHFRQVVRRYAPSKLLPALADLSVASASQGGEIESMLGAPPWAIATIARESILWGNDYRRARVDEDALVAILNAHNSIHEALGEDSVAPFLIRMAYEQFPYQESDYEEVCRSHAMLIEGAREISTEVLSDETWMELFGAPLEQVVGATFFLHVAATLHAGEIKRSWLDRDDLMTLYEAWPKSVIEHRLRGLTYNFDEFRTAYQEAHAMAGLLPPGLERYSFNPLVRRPFVRLPNGRILAPQPRLILRTVSPGALYYACISFLGNGFANDLGRLTQHYVGKQLKSISPGAAVHPEIIYHQGRREMASVDWFVDFPSILVLIEVKSARFGLLERAGFGRYREKVASLLNRAATQVRNSADAIDKALPEFTHLSGDKPRIAIIVTGEPYYLGNSPWFRELVDSPPEFPVLVASLRDIEQLCQLDRSDLEQQLTTIAHDPEKSTWNLSTALTPGLKMRDNEVLRRAWNAYPWPEVPHVQAPPSTSGAGRSPA